MRLIDVHNHLQSERFSDHREAVLARARGAGVSRMIVNGTRPSDWARVRELSERHDGVLAAYGVHPWYVDRAKPGWREALERELDRGAICVGEIGLDRWVRKRDDARQAALFREQLEIAAEHNLPVSIHSVRSSGETLRILQETDLPKCGVLMHAYGGSPEMVLEFTRVNAFFSFGAAILFKKNERARAALQAVPMDRLLLETDAPSLPPPKELVPGHLVDEEGNLLNEPAYLPVILEEAARIRKEQPGTLSEKLWENAERLFGQLS